MPSPNAQTINADSEKRAEKRMREEPSPYLEEASTAIAQGIHDSIKNDFTMFSTRFTSTLITKRGRCERFQVT